MKTINEGFFCVVCKKKVIKAHKTCRNHCPFCFASLHVDDVMPGDRASTCGGVMYPHSYENRAGEIKILFICTKCSKKHRNKRADDDQLLNLPELILEYRGRFS